MAELNIAAWAREPRWRGEKPLITPKRARAIAAKRAWQASPIDLRRCLSGSELVAGFRSGEAFPFGLEARRGREMPPTAAKWELRDRHRRVIAWLATAHIGFKAPGLVATCDELGQLTGHSGRWVRDVLADLTAWGLVHSAPTFVAYGRVTSQRANVYRLTTLATFVWRLVVPGAVGRLPEPVLGDRARAPGRKKLPPIQKLPRTEESSGDHAPCQLAEPPAEAPEREAAAQPVGELVRKPVTDHRSEPPELARQRTEHEENHRRQTELLEQVREREEARRKPATPGELDEATLEHVRRERELHQRPPREQGPVRTPEPEDSLDAVLKRAWSSWGARRGGRS